MASVSTAAVRNALKGSGSVNLKELHNNGYTRTLVGSGYARVNPFQVEAGFAPDPATYAAPHSQNDWELYSHAGFPYDGSNLSATAGHLTCDVSWVRPTGYTRDLGSVSQTVYWKSMGTSVNTNVNPFDAPSGSASVGDVTSYQITGLTPGNYYAIGVKQVWDDSDSSYTTGDGSAYTGAAGQTLLLGPGVGVASGKIASSTPPTPTTQQLTLSSTCSIGDTNVQVRCNYTLDGPGPMTLQRNINNTGWNSIVTGITANGSHTDGYGGMDEIQFRTFYESVSPTTYSAVATRQVFCENL